MTPLDAAMALAADCPAAPYPDDDCWRCQVCHVETGWVFEAVPERFDHESDCPWLMLPKIVAALEAAALMVATIAWVADGQGAAPGMRERAAQDLEAWRRVRGDYAEDPPP